MEEGNGHRSPPTSPRNKEELSNGGVGSTLLKSAPASVHQSRFVIPSTSTEEKESKSPDRIPKSRSRIKLNKSAHPHETKRTIRRKKKKKKESVASSLTRPASFRVSLPQNYRNMGVTGLYGVALDAVMKDYPEWQIPPFVEQICLHIEEKVLDQEGIFRATGNVAEIKRARDTLNDGKVVDFWKIQDHHVVCEMLKLYLRQLPEPLLTYDLYHLFLDAVKEPEEESVVLLKALVHRLPENNKHLLMRLCICMKKVTMHANKNKMDASNLGKVIGPNILHHPCEKETTDPMALLSTGETVSRVVNMLITHLDAIFEGVNYTPYYKCYVKAIAPYTPCGGDELRLKEDDLIMVTDTDKTDEGGCVWYMGECHGVAGYFPADRCTYLNGTPCCVTTAAALRRSGEHADEEKEEEGGDSMDTISDSLQSDSWIFRKDDARRDVDGSSLHQSGSFLSLARLHKAEDGAVSNGDQKDEQPNVRVHPPGDGGERSIQKGIVQSRVTTFMQKGKHPSSSHTTSTTTAAAGEYAQPASHRPKDILPLLEEWQKREKTKEEPLKQANERKREPFPSSPARGADTEGAYCEATTGVGKNEDVEGEKETNAKEETEKEEKEKEKEQEKGADSDEEAHQLFRRLGPSALRDLERADQLGLGSLRGKGNFLGFRRQEQLCKLSLNSAPPAPGSTSPAAIARSQSALIGPAVDRMQEWGLLNARKSEEEGGDERVRWSRAGRRGVDALIAGNSRTLSKATSVASLPSLTPILREHMAATNAGQATGNTGGAGSRVFLSRARNSGERK